jgi:hypothetical protein
MIATQQSHLDAVIDRAMHVGANMIACSAGMTAIVAGLVGQGAAVPGAILGALVGCYLGLRTHY